MTKNNVNRSRNLIYLFGFLLQLIFINLSIGSSGKTENLRKSKYENGIDSYCPETNSAFHLASSKNKLFDSDLISKITSCASIVTLNIRQTVDDENYSSIKIKERFKSANSNLPVLSYFRVTRWKEGTVRADGNILKEIANHPDWWLRETIQQNRLVVFTDFANFEFVDWLVNKVSQHSTEWEDDGVFIDALQRSPKELCGDVSKIVHCELYRKGIDRFLTNLKSELENKLLLFNGLYGDARISEKDTLSMLNRSDGLMVEHFGLVKRNQMRRNKKLPVFDQDIRYYQKIIESYDDKYFVVFGRENTKVNLDTNPDWGAYLYAAYLMIKKDLTSFKFHSSFQIPSKNGLTNGLYVLPEMRLILGEPKAEYVTNGCLQAREFDNYLIVLCDFDYDTGRNYKIEFVLDSVTKFCQLNLVPGDVFFIDKSRWKDFCLQ